MDYAACNVVYVDRTAREDRLVKRDDAISATEDKGPETADDYAPISNGPSPIDENLQVLLETFSEGRSHNSIFQRNSDILLQFMSVRLANPAYPSYPN